MEVKLWDPYIVCALVMYVKIESINYVIKIIINESITLARTSSKSRRPRFEFFMLLSCVQVKSFGWSEKNGLVEEDSLQMSGRL